MRRYIPISCLIVLIGLSLVIGVQSIPFSHITHLNEVEKLVLWTTRIPRTVSLVIAGATMSVSGLIMQHLTQNRFVSPTTAGTMDSARLGMLVAMLFFPTQSTLLRSFIAFLFAFVGTLIFVQLTRILPGRNQLMIPLIGVMYGNIIGSFVTFFAYQYELIQNMTSWLQGSFSTITKGNYELIYISVPLLIVCYLYAYQFTVVGMGEELSISIGLNYKKVYLIGLLIISVASSVILVTIGGLPFIGVIIPNIVSMIYGDQMKKTLWNTAVFGSIFLVISDILSRVIYPPYEIPVSLIAGILGSVIFIVLLVKGGRK